MKALIVEKNHHGHYLWWVACLVRGLRGVADRIVVALPPGAETTQQFAIYLAPLQDQFTLATLDWSESLQPIRRNSGRVADMIISALHRSRADALFMPTADEFIDAINLASLQGRRIGSACAHSEALIMGRPSAYGVQETRVPLWILNAGMRLAPWTRVLTTCPIIADWLRTSCGPRIAERTVLAPDPIETFDPIAKAEARRRLALPTDGRIVGMLGLIGRPKGLDLLLAAFRRTELGARDKLLLAGPCSEEARSMFDAVRTTPGMAGRILTMDRFLTHQELHTCASACDVIAVPYRYHTQPSGIAIRSLAAGRPIIAGDRGWYARMVPAFAMGTTCDIYDDETFAAALSDALESSADFEPSPRARRLLAFQSPENLANTWRAGLAERLGLSASHPKPIEWSWVLDA